MEEAAKHKGLIATVLFHASIIALLLILRLYGAEKLPDAEGITINFGTDMAGMGTTEPEQQEANQPEPVPKMVVPPVKTKPIKEKVKESAPNLLTQETEAAPTVKKQDNEKDLAEKKKLDEKKRQEREEREIQRQTELERQRLAAIEQQRVEAEQKKKAEQDSKVNAMKSRMGKSFGGNSTNAETQGEGNSQTVGNQGDPTGSVDSKNQGPGGGKGAGISFSLDGRNVVGGLAKPEYAVNDYGDVVVTITVNKDGDVISAIPGAKGTTTTDSRLWEAARKAAVSARFNKVTGNDAPIYQKGTITYKFRLL